MAKEASDRAAAVLKTGAPGDDAYQQALAEFDLWLRPTAIAATRARRPI